MQNFGIQPGRGDPERVAPVLVVTNMIPSATNPARGVFVVRQVDAAAEHLSTRPVILPVETNGVRAIRNSRRAVRDAIGRIRPALIHVYYGLTGITLPCSTTSPIVLTLCGSDVLWGRNSASPRGWLEYLVSVVTAWRAVAVTAESTVLRDALPPGTLRDRTVILPPGVDLAAFQPMDRDRCRATLGWPREAPIVLFPSHPSHPGRFMKRYALARAAVSGLRTAAGREVRLEALIDVHPEQVPTYMNAADCVLITSKWEGGPLSLSEALACGTPVVSVPVGYARDPAWQCAQLRVVPADEASLRAAVLDVLDHPPPRERPRTIVLPDRAMFGARLAEVYRTAIRER